LRPAKLGAADDSVRISGSPSAWERGVASVLGDVEVECLAPQLPRATCISRYVFGDLEFRHTTTRAGAHRAMRTQNLIRRTGNGDYFVCFLLSGSAAFCDGDGNRRIELKGRDIGIVDSLAEYAVETPGKFDALWARAPRRQLESRLNMIAEGGPHRIAGDTGVGNIASSMVLSMLAQNPRIEAAAARWLAGNLFDLIGMSLPEAQARLEHVSGHRGSLLRRAQAYIAQHLGDEDLSPSKVAAELDISTRYLNKLFETNGMSVARWIREQRLERCRSEVENPLQAEARIIDIAFTHGFRNVSSFNRAFRARYGRPPTAFRQ
jgi:AraC family transcriptional activator of tynA and feaB